MGAVLLGDEGDEVEDTAGVAPLVIVPFGVLARCFEVRKVRERVRKTYQDTSLMKFWFRAIPALASKMEEALWPLRSEETISSSV